MVHASYNEQLTVTVWGGRDNGKLHHLHVRFEIFWE
jgi:hypothetical protein